MYDGANKSPHHAKASTAVEETERRSGNRRLFTASAEVTEVTSGARFSTRTTDLGPGGCFVDTTNPFPVGAGVRIAIRKGKNEFHTSGTVVYSQHGLGMGISFSGLDEGQRKALEQWIHGLTDNVHAAAYGSQPADRPEMGNEGTAQRALTRLVRLMISKGMLTEAEGASVLMDPVL